MSGITNVAASALQAQQYNLDLIASNIANLNTTGYRKSRAIFTSAPHGPADAASARARAQFTEGTGVTLAAIQRIMSPGSLTETGNLWDMAIAGDGFFSVALADGTKVYTRDGSFRLDGQGHLSTLDGLLVDPPLTIPANALNVTVDGAGVVTGEVNGQRTEFGSISVATFPSPEGLVAMGNNLYAPSDTSGEAQAGQPGVGGRGQIVSGVLETSNVDLAEEMTKILEAQRAYQLSLKVLQNADEMLGLADNLRR